MYLIPTYCANLTPLIPLGSYSSDRTHDVLVTPTPDPVRPGSRFVEPAFSQSELNVFTISSCDKRGACNFRNSLGLLSRGLVVLKVLGYF